MLPGSRTAEGACQQIFEVFSAHGLQPRLGATTAGHELAVASVAAGRGYTLCLPTLNHPDDQLVLRALAEPVPPIDMLLLTRRDDDTPAVVDLTRIARAMRLDNSAPAT